MDEKKMKKQVAKCYINFQYGDSFFYVFNKIKKFNNHYESFLNDILKNRFDGLFYIPTYKDNFIFCVQLPWLDKYIPNNLFVKYLCCEVLYNQDGGGVGIDINTLIRKIVLERHKEIFKNNIPNFDIHNCRVIIGYNN